MAIYLMKERTGLTNQEICAVFGGSSSSAIAKAYQRLRRNLKENRNLSRRVAKIKKILSYVKG